MIERQVYRSFLLRFCSTLFQVRAFVIAALILNSEGEIGYGIWSLAWSFLHLATAFIVFQLDTAIVRFLSGTTESATVSASRFWAGFSFIIGLAAIVVATLVTFRDSTASALFGSQEYRYVIPALGAWVLVHAVSTYLRSIHRVNADFVRWTLVEGVQTLLQIAAVWTALHLLQSGAVGSILAATAAEVPAIIYCFIQSTKQFRPTRLQVQHLTPILYFAVPLIPITLLSWITGYSDHLMIAHYWDVAATGVYAAIYLIGRLPHQFSAAVISFVLISEASRLWNQNEKERLRRLLAGSRAVFIAAVSLISVAVFLNRGLLQKILSLPSLETPTLALVLTSTMIGGFYNIDSQILLLQKETRRLLAIFAFVGCLNIILNLILIPQFGLVGAAFSTAVAFGLQAGLTYVRGRSLIPRTWPRGLIVPTLLFFTASAIVEGTIGVGSSLVRAITSASLGITYLIWAIRHIGASERSFARGGTH